MYSFIYSFFPFFEIGEHTYQDVRDVLHLKYEAHIGN